MYGVILWSNPSDRKAVIWCEDHGDLVYFEEQTQPSSVDAEFFGAGDYVEFEAVWSAGVRRARTARTVLSASFPMLAHQPDTTAASNMTSEPRSTGYSEVVHLANRALTTPTQHMDAVSRRG